MKNLKQKGMSALPLNKTIRIVHNLKNIVSNVLLCKKDAEYDF